MINVIFTTIIFAGNDVEYITVKPVLSDHTWESQRWSLKTGRWLIQIMQGQSGHIGKQIGDINGGLLRKGGA